MAYQDGDFGPYGGLATLDRNGLPLPQPDSFFAADQGGGDASAMPADPSQGKGPVASASAGADPDQLVGQIAQAKDAFVNATDPAGKVNALWQLGSLIVAASQQSQQADGSDGSGGASGNPPQPAQPAQSQQTAPQGPDDGGAGAPQRSLPPPLLGQGSADDGSGIPLLPSDQQNPPPFAAGLPGAPGGSDGSQQPSALSQLSSGQTMSAPFAAGLPGAPDWMAGLLRQPGTSLPPIQGQPNPPQGPGSGSGAPWQPLPPPLLGQQDPQQAPGASSGGLSPFGIPLLPPGQQNPPPFVAGLAGAPGGVADDPQQLGAQQGIAGFEHGSEPDTSLFPAQGQQATSQGVLAAAYRANGAQRRPGMPPPAQGGPNTPAAPPDAPEQSVSEDGTETTINKGISAWGDQMIRSGATADAINAVLRSYGLAPISQDDVTRWQNYLKTNPNYSGSTFVAKRTVQLTGIRYAANQLDNSPAGATLVNYFDTLTGGHADNIAHWTMGTDPKLFNRQRDTLNREHPNASLLGTVLADVNLSRSLSSLGLKAAPELIERAPRLFELGGRIPKWVRLGIKNGVIGGYERSGGNGDELFDPGSTAKGIIVNGIGGTAVDRALERGIRLIPIHRGYALLRRRLGQNKDYLGGTLSYLVGDPLDSLFNFGSSQPSPPPAQNPQPPVQGRPRQ